MTRLLEKAIAKVSKLPAADQDAIAGMIMDELLDEKRWDVAFARSQDKLAKLASKVREDIRAGRVSRMGFDQL
ncbi:MAG: hypothetical protein FJ279_17155 [Planctomycetes bacterium]|nr:hypothetical protein [Planctomycetota bacterium]MBM4080616.1 hypothetical protein [Planctomycetota bacterium]MBM4087633.1 hypothetical protein [Planctomycetota bacterium]